MRTHIAIFRADTQPAELRALREVALRWMLRLAEFRPHVGGAVWRGTATRQSVVRLDLYCDDMKAPEIALLNKGVDYETVSEPLGRDEHAVTLVLGEHDRALGDWVTIHLNILDTDDLRGALKPDARGQSWRGDAEAPAPAAGRGGRRHERPHASRGGWPGVTLGVAGLGVGAWLRHRQPPVGDGRLPPPRPPRRRASPCRR